MRRLTIAVHNHYGEANAFIGALRAAGHEFVTEGPADLLLIDLDPPLSGYQRMIAEYADRGAKIVLYPHGAGGPILSYDALFEPDPRVDANFVIGPGQAEYLRRIDYPAPVHVLGWSFCPLRPFRPRPGVGHVVFAPIHPNADGSMADDHRAQNSDVYARLLEGSWRLTVRHIGALEENGLWEADGVAFVNGRLHADWAEIDAADAVVAGSGTFPALAIARGVPAVMYCQASPALGVPGEQPVPLWRADRYLDYIRYPYDAADGPLDELLHAAARSDEAIAHWRRRFVGAPFDPRGFVALIEGLFRERPGAGRIDPTRGVTTLAFADELAARPELLREYAARYGPDDDASLILWTPGLDERGLLALAQQAIAAAGVDDTRLPDILLVPLPGSPDSDARLAERADALLSEWPAAGRIGALPRFA
jgi:hypothetical protein